MRLRAFAEAWVAYWAQTAPPTPLALIRVALALCALGTLGHMAWSGVVLWVWGDLDFGGYRHNTPGHWWWSVVSYTEAGLWGTMGLAALAGGLVLVGLGGRASSLLLLVLTVALTSINPESGGGHDRLLTNALWLLVLSPASRTLSLDCRLRTGAWADITPRPAWTRDLFLFQLVLVYLMTGVQKMGGADWMPWGELMALHYALQLPSWQRWELSAVLGWVTPLTQLATAGTMLFELGAPLLLLGVWSERHPEGGRLVRWARRVHLRRWFVLAAVMFHLGIDALMNIGPFSWVSMAYLFAAFEHHELVAAWRWVRRRPA